MIKNIIHHARTFLSNYRHLTTGKKRSGQWHTVEKKFLEENPVCQVCGSNKHLQVHHIKPFHLYPELELDPTNLVTLCMDTKECHLKLAHGGNFKTYCPEIKQYAEEIKKGEKTFEEMYKIAEESRLKN